MLDAQLLVTISSGLSLPFLCTNFDNALGLGFPSAMVINNVRMALKFSVRNDSGICS